MASSLSPFHDIINRFASDRLQPEEVDKFFVFLEQEGFQSKYGEQIDEALLEQAYLQWSAEVPSEELYQKIIHEAQIGQRSPVIAVHRVHFLKTAWFRYAAAIIILFGIGAYLWNTQHHWRTITQTQPVPVEKDVLPGSDKAILTLADGQKIQLDSNANNLLAEKGISNSNAIISYSNKDAASVINTLTTPNGGQYKIKLSDGTMVWLNAASSITYPTSFTGNKRAVDITGEVYFEVAPNKSKPFIVNTGKDNINVLGTSFNIHSYPNEIFKTSLIEGAIKVNEDIIQPGHAYVNGHITPTNVEQDVAWKNGIFNFNNVDLRTAMNQIARWYNVQVVYQGTLPPFDFYGKMGRDLSLQQVLNGLSGLGVQFNLTNEKILVISPIEK